MPDSKTRLLQRIHRVGATSITFLLMLSACSLIPTDAERSTTTIDPAPEPEPVEAPLIELQQSAWEPREAQTFAPPDLLLRLRQGFELSHEDNNRIRAERDWFVKHPDYLTRVFTRAQRYLPHITAELESRDLPLDLALLPIVESAYDPFAYSHGRAAGLWQMIPGTAKRFGVKQNWWYDGRRDIVDSTRAALDYLEYLQKFNEGNWLNAIAS